MNSYKQDINHPLQNKIWSITKQQFVTEQQLINTLSKEQVILLGETHDNPQHHQLQASIIQSLSEQQLNLAIAFEMLDQNKQEMIHQFQIDKTHDKHSQVDEFARLVNWEKSGWPKWSLYRPIFEQTLNNNFPIIAANLNSQLIRKVVKEGPKVLTTQHQALIKKYSFKPLVQKKLEQEILHAHCDMLPNTLLSPMLLAQQTRDIAMTQTIIDALNIIKDKRSVILIAGSGHIRKDYGIPFYLQQEKPHLNIKSIAFIEAGNEQLTIQDYANDWNSKELPFDYVWFTNKEERSDPCERMKQIKK